mgnify:CR=1 FL=1
MLVLLARSVSGMIRVMKKYRAVIGVACVVVALSLVGYLLVRDTQFAILQPAGDIAKQQRDLLIFATAMMGIVVVPIFAMLAWFGWKYRAGNKASKKADYTPEWHENKRLELLWWGVPSMIIAVLAVTAWYTSHSLDPYKKIESDKVAIEVQVVALQWKWLFMYPDLGIATVNKLPIPEQTPVHFTISADAPMSAFWIPSLGTQIYAMNGMSSQLNLIADHTGEFAGYTTNINGEGYADMKFTTYAKTEADFTAWTKSAMISPNVMDEAMYARLTTPGLADEATYVLKDKDLYNKIVAKYMHGMSTESGSHTMPDGSTMDNSELKSEAHVYGMEEM